MEHSSMMARRRNGDCRMRAENALESVGRLPVLRALGVISEDESILCPECGVPLVWHDDMLDRWQCVKCEQAGDILTLTRLVVFSRARTSTDTLEKSMFPFNTVELCAYLEGMCDAIRHLSVRC